MGRIMWVVGVLGFLTFTASALLGFRVEGWYMADGIALEMRLHLLVGALGAVLIFFAHGWVAIYLTLTGRLLRRHGAVGTVDGDELSVAVHRGTRRGVPLAILAALAAVATILLGMPALTGFAKPILHLVVGTSALLLQALALALQWPLLGRHETLVRRTDQALAA